MKEKIKRKNQKNIPASLTNVKKFFPKIKSITDSKKNIRIEVTKGDASSKAVKQHDACAFAVACKRTLHLDGTIISRTIAYLIKGDKAVRYKLPSSVEKEIVSFDRGSEFAIGE